MQAPKYILKNIYSERIGEWEYQHHIDRMKNIKPSMDLMKPAKQIINLEKRAISQHQKAYTFKLEEKQREEKLVNKALINKLLDISDGKFSIVKNLMTSSAQPNTRSMKQTGGTDPRPISKNSIKSIKEEENQSKNAEKNEKQTTISKLPSQLQIETMRPRVLSEFIKGTGTYGSLNNLIKKKELDRIQVENQILAQRMITLPPMCMQKNKLDEQYKEHKKLKKMVRKFHPSVENKKPIKVKKNDVLQNNDDGFDETNEELMNQKIHAVIRLIDISFINFLPVNWEEEKYFLEIKAGTKPPRRTTAEMYMDFSKSVINEFFLLKDLKKSKTMYIALFQRKDSQDRFLGDFELDLTPYIMETMTKEIHHDLRNWKELHNLPNYMPKDMRKKGWIDFELIIKSNLKQYLDNLQKVDEKDEESDEEKEEERDLKFKKIVVEHQEQEVDTSPKRETKNI